MKHCLFLALALLTVWTRSYGSDFNDFLSLLKKIDSPALSSFGDKTVTNSFVDGVPLGGFLPPTDSTRAHNIFWQGGSYMDNGKYLTVFLKCHMDDYQDGNSRYLMENLVTKYVIATYTYDGKLIDHKAIAAEGDAYYFDFAYQKGRYDVTQYSLKDYRQLLDYENPTYTVSQAIYTINDAGHISDTMIEKGEINVANKDIATIKPMTFLQFKNLFVKCNTMFCSDSLFSYRTSFDTSYPSLRNIVPIAELRDNNNWLRDMVYWCCHYIEESDRYVFFVIRDCESPRSGYPYSEKLIWSFRKNGEFIESLTLSKEGKR